MRVGIVCPKCHTYNDVEIQPRGEGQYEDASFRCKQCGAHFKIGIDKNCNVKFVEVNNTILHNLV